jgi:hypothetical protein
MSSFLLLDTVPELTQRLHDKFLLMEFAIDESIAPDRKSRQPITPQG